MGNTWEDYWFTGVRPGSGPARRPMSHYEHERAQTALTQRDLREDRGGRTVVDQYGWQGSGTDVHPMHHADVPGMMQTAPGQNGAQLRELLRPLQERFVYQPGVTDRSEQEMLRQQMLEILQRPAWDDHRRQDILNWMRQFGLLTDESSNMDPNMLFGPP